MSNTTADVALFVSRQKVFEVSSQQRIFLPFFGGPDDRSALSLVVQLCRRTDVQAVILRLQRRAEDDLDSQPAASDPAPESANLDPKSARSAHYPAETATALPDTVYGEANQQSRLQSDTADSLAWDYYAKKDGRVRSQAEAGALSRIRFMTITSSTPLASAISHHSSSFSAGQSNNDLIVLGRSRRMADSHREETESILSAKSALASHVRKTLGDPASAFMVSQSSVNLIVVQAALH